MKAKGGIAALCMLTVACSNAQKVCEANIKGTLLNPETAQFLDFQKTDANGYWQALGVAPGDEAGRSVFAFGGKMPPEGGQVDYYTLRVRADSKLGNRITSEMACYSSGSSCECTSAPDE